MERKDFMQRLIEFFDSNPDMFVRCDCDGKENPQGGYWRVREKGDNLLCAASRSRDNSQ